MKDENFSPELEQTREQLKKALNDPAAEKVPEALLPENIAPKLKGTEKIVRFPVRRFAAMAAAIVIVVAAVVLLPNFLSKSNLTSEADPDPTLAVSTGARALAAGGYEAVEAAISSRATEYSDKYITRTDAIAEGYASAPQMSPTAPQRDDSKSDESEEPEYSTTNVQVDGVDEPDIIKTDGKYIYFVTTDAKGTRSVRIADANGGSLKELYSFPTPEDWYVSDIFLSENRLIVMMGKEFTNYRYMTGSTSTRIEVYDTTDPASPKLVRYFEQEGNYRSARLIDNTLLLVSVKHNYFDYYSYMNSGSELPQAEDLIPKICDSSAEKELVAIPPECCYVMPYGESLNFSVVSLIDVSDSRIDAETVTIMGEASTIYASTENIYIAQSRWNYSTIMRKASTEGAADYATYTGGDFTDITKISYTGGKLGVVAQGTVKGSLCDQFAMDEFEGNLRVGTNHSGWDSDETNNFYVLDSQMNIIGSLEGLAKNENMYSVRFEGSRVYAVTYRTVDPFFVIDLSDPTNPKVTGELKIPGYSDYLHTYSDNLVIGFGMNTVESTDKLTALTQGFKVAMFDVSDPSSPKELHTIYIGDRGSNSELSYNHKALLFSKEKNIIAFPMTIARKDADAGVYDYGKTVFTGYIILGYDEDSGFTVKGKVSLGSDGAENYWQLDIRRGIYIDDVLYVLTDYALAAFSLDDYTELSRLEYAYEVSSPVEPVISIPAEFSTPEVSIMY